MKYHVALKFTAILLCALMLLGAVASGVGIAVLASGELYSTDVQTLRARQERQNGESRAMEFLQWYGARELGGCPEELVESYYAWERFLGLMDEGLLEYEILDWNREVLESGGRADPAPGAWMEFTVPRWSYLRLVEEVDMAPEAEQTLPATRTEDSPEETTVPATEPVADTFHYGFYDPQTGRDRQFLLCYESAPGMIVRLRMAGTQTLDDQLWEGLEILWNLRMHLFWVLGLTVLLFGALAVYLCCAAGHRPKSREIRAGGLNRIPLDVSVIVAASAVTGIAFVCVEGGEWLLRQNLQAAFLLAALGAYGAALIIVCFFFAFAAQVKTPGGFWWRGSLLGRCVKGVVFLWNLALKILAWLLAKAIALGRWGGEKTKTRLLPLGKRLLKGLWKLAMFFWSRLVQLVKKLWDCFKRICTFLGRKLLRFLMLLPLTWQWLLVGFGLIFVLLVTVNARSPWMMLLGMGLTVALVLYGSSAFGILLESAGRMCRGDLNTKVDDRYLVGCFREFAQELDGLADVAVVAAQKQLKSERMKTELITNVSHDIKTPLTSIINYVDLLEKPHTPQEQEQYLEVLNRQSQRLKKLIDDLMEMSKASTGNMAVEPEEMDAVEAVNQALGEFADKLTQAGLHPVFRHPEEPVKIRADGKLTWRVMNNILSNAVKYAMPGTRLYVDLGREGERVTLSVKNISREELNVEAEELMERFVRGDASRNTEGSGLGLNIARTLMELQQGKLELLVDGDLFKVTLIFPGV